MTLPRSRQSAHLNNQPVVAFQVLRSTGSVLVSVEEGVRLRWSDWPPPCRTTSNFELIFTRADEIRDSYQASIDALIRAACWRWWWWASFCATGGPR
jgi:multidrug efflux pump subunit AcrB